MTQTARAQAIAKADEAIQSNVAKIEAAKKPNALELMAHRLNISPASLSKTLRATVFSKANDDEFAALMIVAETYKLNPLLKEIYAFPAKGGGIVPIVSIDGWLRIINEHPMFDGMEHNDIPDADGKLIAIETVIYRKDRTHPIKIVEYLEECQGNTDPWKKLPARMLRHKSTIQCARYAFGFAGIYDEDEGRQIGDIQLVGDAPVAPMRSALKTLPPQERQQDDEEVARQLDRNYDPETGEIFDEEHVDEQAATDDAPPYVAQVAAWKASFARHEIMADWATLADEIHPHLDALPDDVREDLIKARDDAQARIKGGAK